MMLLISNVEAKTTTVCFPIHIHTKMMTTTLQKTTFQRMIIRTTIIMSTMMMMMVMIMMLLISNVATVTAKGLTSSKGDIRFLMPIIGDTDVKSYFNEDPIILVDDNDILDEINSNVNNNNNNNINAKNAN